MRRFVMNVCGCAGLAALVAAGFLMVIRPYVLFECWIPWMCGL
jgi:hypothetical protein